MNYENPARRLLIILENGKDLSHPLTCEQAWSQLLETEDNTSLLLARLGKLMLLPADILRTMHDLYPENVDVTQYWHKKVCHMLVNLNLEDQWVNSIRKIDDNSMTQLKMTAMLLDQKLQRNSLDKESIANTRSIFQDIHDELIDSDIAQELKIFVLRKLRDIIVSIDEYKLTGLMPILDAVDSSIGHCVTNSAYKEFISDTPLGKRLAAALTATADSITIATGLPAIASSIQGLWLLATTQ